ncbi:MAG: ATP synthase subunit I [Nitrospinota bacterium]
MPAGSSRESLRQIERLGWALLLLVAPLAFWLLESRTTGGLLLGGVVALLNFRSMDLYFGRLMDREKPRPRWPIHALYLARYPSMGAVLLAGYAWGGLGALGILLGFSVVVVAIVAWGLGSWLRAPGAGGPLP